MKKLKVLFLILFSVISYTLQAQTRDYKVVFDLTSSDTLNQKAVLRWVSEVVNAEPNASVEVVLFGKSLNMVVKDKSTFAESVTKLAANKNVAFKVCAVAMKTHQIDKSQLLPGVQIVPDGIYEVISKQKEGWGYIKGVL